VAFGLLAIAVAATAFRRGDGWAWWALLVGTTRVGAMREEQLALFALEVKYEFVLRHEEGCLKARWAPQKMTSLFNFGFNFPPNFDTQKCQSVLEATQTLAGSIERRAGALSQAEPGAPTSAAPDAI
jgi:hypothetical protein